MKTSNLKIRSGDEAGGLKKTLIAGSLTALTTLAILSGNVPGINPEMIEALTHFNPDGFMEVISGSYNNLVDGLKELVSSIPDPQKAAAQSM
jgi:hypothetical protein